MHAYFRPPRTRYQRMTFRCMAGRSPDFCIDFIQRTIGSLAEKPLRTALKRIEIGRCTIVVTFIGRFVEATLCAMMTFVFARSSATRVAHSHA